MKKSLTLALLAVSLIILTPAANAGVLRFTAKETVKVAKFTAPKAGKATVAVAKGSYKVGKAIFKIVY